MKEILERIGLVDLFAYICPGILVLLSFTLWVTPDFKSEMWKQQILVIVAVVLFSYAVGIVLSSTVIERRLARIRAQEASTRPSGLARWLGWLGPFPAPRVTPEMVDVNLRINDELGRLIGVPGLSQRVTSWEFLVLYRTLMTQRVGDAVKPLLNEAEAFHRRFRFCSGVSLACAVIVVQAAARLVLGGVQGVARSFGYCTATGGHRLPAPVHGFVPCPLPDISIWLLLALIVFGVASSVALRHVGNHMWELERYLTFSLMRRPIADEGRTASDFGR